MESDYVSGFVYICLGFNFSALLIKIYFDLSLIWLVINMLLRMQKLEIYIYIYIYTCWVAEDLIFSCFMEKIYSDLVLFFLTITITLAC